VWVSTQLPAGARDQTKTMCYGLLYGMGTASLAHRMQVQPHQLNL
jgi:DNA polymerase I-like protein with 3'-5' exonuclease and polymerase domains